MLDDNLDVSIIADYVNHDDWPSPIEVPDFTDWENVYGRSIVGSVSDNNDGTMTGVVKV